MGKIHSFFFSYLIRINRGHSVVIAYDIAYIVNYDNLTGFTFRIIINAT